VCVCVCAWMCTCRMNVFFVCLCVCGMSEYGCMHVCACMCACMHGCVCMWVHTSVCVCIDLPVPMHASMFACVCMWNVWVPVPVCECVHGWMLFCDVSLCIPVQLCVREICVLYFSLFVDCHSQLHVETFSFTHNKQMYLLTWIITVLAKVLWTFGFAENKMKGLSPLSICFLFEMHGLRMRQNRNHFKVDQELSVLSAGLGWRLKCTGWWISIDDFPTRQAVSLPMCSIHHVAPLCWTAALPLATRRHMRPVSWLILGERESFLCSPCLVAGVFAWVWLTEFTRLAGELDKGSVVYQLWQMVCFSGKNRPLKTKAKRQRRLGWMVVSWLQ